MLKQRRDCILSDCCELMKELKDTCECHLRALTDADTFEKILPYNPIALIMKTIKNLASQQLLKELDDIIKVKYESVFEPIPDVNLFPDHEPVQICLKDKNKKMMVHLYSCPRQYREAFAKLIQ